MNNFIRNPTNNEVINKIIDKYKLANKLELSRIEKKELKKQLFNKYQEIKELIKLKQNNL